MTTRLGLLRTPQVTVLALVLALGLGLAGCSGDDGEGGEGGDGAEAASETATEGTTSPPDLPEPDELRNPEGAAADVEWDAASCATEAGEQSVDGTVTNSTDDRTSYVITVSWTNATSDVLGRGVYTAKNVRPGDSEDWDMTAEVSDGAVQCVINVLRGDLKKNQS
jgi:hypothetical protein